jgi:hypothetical protein
VFLLIPNRSKIQHLKSLVIIVSELFIAGFVLRQLRNFDGIISCFDLKVLFARELDKAVSILVINDDQNLLIAQATQLNGLLQEAPFSFAESNISLQLVFNQSKFIDLLFAHAISI